MSRCGRSPIASSTVPPPSTATSPVRTTSSLRWQKKAFGSLRSICRTPSTRSSDPLERLRRGLWAFYEFSKTNPQYFELMFIDRSVPSLTQDFQRFEFFQETTARAEADVRACIERGQFSAALNPGGGVARPLGRDARAVPRSASLSALLQVKTRTRWRTTCSNRCSPASPRTSGRPSSRRNVRFIPRMLFSAKSAHSHA